MKSPFFKHFGPTGHNYTDNQYNKGLHQQKQNVLKRFVHIYIVRAAKGISSTKK